MVPFFFQALPYRGKIYFHEMGYRLSGGMIYKLTEPLMGINDMKMMIRNALGGDCLTPDEAEKIDLTCQGRCGAQLMIPGLEPEYFRAIASERA